MSSISNYSGDTGLDMRRDGPGSRSGVDSASRDGTSLCGDQGDLNPGTPGLVWTFDIPVLNNVLVIRDMALAFGIGLIVVAAIVLIASEAWLNPRDFMEFLKFIGIIIGILVALFILSAALLRNAIPTRFFLNSDGVGYEAATSRERNISILAIIIGAVTRSPGTMGAGMIAASHESDFCAWGNVKKVTVYQRQRAIDIRYSVFKPIRLYCTEENYPVVLDFIKRNTPHATFRMW